MLPPGESRGVCRRDGTDRLTDRRTDGRTEELYITLTARRGLHDRSSEMAGIDDRGATFGGVALFHTFIIVTNYIDISRKMNYNRNRQFRRLEL